MAKLSAVKYGWFAVAAALLYSGAVIANRRFTNRAIEQKQAGPPPGNQELERLYATKGVRILQFYATPGSRSMLLCYGVVNAKSVRVEPPVDGVSPSLSRCVELPPSKATKYTLTAEGADGGSVSASFDLAAKP